MRALILALYLSSCATVPAFAEFQTFDRSLDPTNGANITMMEVRPKTPADVPAPRAKPETVVGPDAPINFDKYTFNINHLEAGTLGQVETLDECVTFIQAYNSAYLGGFFCTPQLKEAYQ